jgi:DNA modification methylase
MPLNLYYEESGVEIYNGDALETLREMEGGSVDCCVTSPPYWSLRDYGVPGQIGLERAPGAYVERLVEVFREVRRALTGAGTMFLVLGDSYARDSRKGRHKPGDSGKQDYVVCRGGGRTASMLEMERIRSESRGSSDGKVGRADRAPIRVGADNLKPKDLVGVPWMVAFALREDGWYLRSDIVWQKPNCLPESVTDRPTKCHEYVFMLAKSERYYYDHRAVAEPTIGGHKSGNKERKLDTPTRPYDHRGASIPWEVGEEGMRNRRSVWTIPTRAFRGAHFAVFPEALAEVCILAGTPAGGVVIDPFGGAGTVGIAASRLGRRAVIVELKEQYCELAAERLARSVGARRTMDGNERVGLECGT